MQDETPLLKQYRSVKAEYPDAILMFRIGDFFEMLEGDAEIAARELELTLTSKAMGKSGRLPLAGVPHHAVENYIARLVRKGYHIAVCDQTEDPKKAKGLVRREVTRVVTPGTWIGSDGRSNKFIAAVLPIETTSTNGGGADRFFVAICDLLTGELYWAAPESRANLESVLVRFKPAEVLAPDSGGDRVEPLLRELHPDVFVTRCPDWKFASSFADDLLRRHFRVATLAPFGLAENASDAARPAAALISYLAETQKSALAHITTLVRVDLAETVALDASTMLQLEIVDSVSRDKECTLLAILDVAVTAMGSRLIARRLTAPLKSPAAIRERLLLVEAFHDDVPCREKAREALKRVGDLERLSGRISLGTVTPREVVGLASSLDASGELAARLAHPALESLRTRIDAIPELAAMIRERLVETPPAEIGTGPLFRDGVDSRLDDLRHGSKSSRQWIANLQAIEREKTGISSLKVSFNNVFGYYIEVTRPNLSKVPDHYRRKQTTSTGERFFTEELKHHEDIVMRANEKLTELETELFTKMRADISEYLPRLKNTAGAVSVVDLSAAFAEVAARRRYVKPEIIDSAPTGAGAESSVMRIENGRHPVVEALLSGEDSFVPNNVELGRGARFMILTGPNMAGKSTYIRQVALMAIMAQVGCFVPAERCALTPFDGIFGRIGASDRLARGLSTFMVEMIEAAMILRNATPRSLVILDEIGRGTSTYDGLSIAWAIVEALAGRGALALFATHYHEITVLADQISGVFNATVAVKEWGEQIHFLHEIRPGAADRSYGIQVAAIAGVPQNVISRAKEILGRLEVGELRTGSGASPAKITMKDEPDEPQLSLFDVPALSPEQSNALETLKEVDPDTISPRDAHALLARLKESLQ